MWLPAFKYIKKFAKLGQFQLPDGSEYQGAYTIGPDGVARTGDIPSVSSKVLISIDIPLEEGANDDLGQYTSEKIVPTPEDYEKGFMLRYFVKKDTSNKIIEVSKNNYGKHQAKGFMKTCILKWILTKPTKDIFNSGYLYKGSITRNKENTKIASNEVKGLDKFITEYDKFIEIESDIEGYKFEELPYELKVKIINSRFSNLQSEPKVKPKPRFKKPPKRIPSQPGNTTQIPRGGGFGGGRAFTGYEDEGFNEESEFNSSQSNTDQNERLYQY